MLPRSGSFLRGAELSVYFVYSISTYHMHTSSARPKFQSDTKHYHFLQTYPTEEAVEYVLLGKLIVAERVVGWA